MPKMPKIPAAQRAPEILAGHQHKRYAQQAKAYQQNTAGKVRGLRTALGAAGRLPLMPGTAACGRSAPCIAAGGTFWQSRSALVPELFVDFCRNEIVPWYCFSLSCFLKKRYAYSL